MMASNPFSSRYLEPGAIPFCFRDKQTLEVLAQRFGKWQHRGHSSSLRLAIVGPHGSGKSTLMSHLSRRLDCPLVVLHSSMSKWNGLKLVMQSARKQRVFLVDGYEQLPVWGQVLLLARSKLHRDCSGRSHRRFSRPLWNLRLGKYRGASGDRIFVNLCLTCTTGGGIPSTGIRGPDRLKEHLFTIGLDLGNYLCQS
jgi:hypothetical protein